MSRELDYQIATEVLGYPPFDWQVSDRLAKEFSYGDRHHGNPCMVCGREPAPWDLECLPKYSSNLAAFQSLDDAPFYGSLVESCQQMLLRARGKEMGSAP